MGEKLGHRLLFKLEGSAFHAGFPLHTTIGALTDLQAIFDKTYLVLSGKQRISEAERNTFQLISREFRKGSFEAYFTILLAGGQLGFDFVTLHSPG